MRQVKAKRIRRAIYGDYAHRDARYFIDGNKIVRDELRRAFQKAKKVGVIV